MHATPVWEIPIGRLTLIRNLFKGGRGFSRDVAPHSRLRNIDTRCSRSLRSLKLVKAAAETTRTNCRGRRLGIAAVP
ncbi:hypothetical protein Y032_0956g3209 [Ancylostoma ceylanicum]|uniref:Uncharacterized protein n=1 Tax=Ancylostoma ceylanicum TaxID=53326 RepID=A0A016WA88_9BILA|nr:hypothetical protein Y032_0956g3209 [Ancylostoma ceylanicum]